MKKVLKGKIENVNLIESIENVTRSNSVNPNLRDGMRYKFNLSSVKMKKEITLSETNLDDTFKQLLDIAQKKQDSEK